MAGSEGMLGSTLCKQLEGYDCEVLTSNKEDLDLRNQEASQKLIKDTKPDLIFLAAAKVGGILANKLSPVEFLYDNLMIETNVINAAYLANVERLVFFASSAIYPEAASQPIQEESLLTGALEPITANYALAKIAGVKLCQALNQAYGCKYFSAIPGNLYGPNDNFDPVTSHVLPALMRKIHLAKINRLPQVILWGSGLQRREFLHVEDCADAAIHLVQVYDKAEPLNIGTGFDMSIADIAETLACIIGYEGEFVYDSSKPDGVQKRLLDISKLRALNWQPKIDFQQGVKSLYDWYLSNNL